MLKHAHRFLWLFSSVILMAGCDPGPTENVLIGTWEITFPYGMDATTFMTFSSDYTMVSFGDSISGPNKIYFHGRWSADENQITIRPETGGYAGETWEWHIVKKRSKKLYLHFGGHDYDDIWTRRSIAPPQASNQARGRVISQLSRSIKRGGLVSCRDGEVFGSESRKAR
jgi:hypothetical protein